MTYNKRVKPDKPTIKPIDKWADVDNYICRIGELQLKINAAQEEANGQINEAKADLAKAVKPLQEKSKLYAASLEAFAVLHKGEFGKKRSKKLNYGTIGWRKSTTTSVTKNTLELIKKVLSKAKAAACIRIKESVDKEALAKLTDEQLASVSARRKVTDDFFVEPSLPEAVDYV